MATLLRTMYSINEWVSTGGDTNWAFSFVGGYIDKGHVKVALTNLAGEVATYAVNTATDFVSDFTLRITPVVPTGWRVRIYRETPRGVPLVDFAGGARVSETSLDTNAKQAVFLATEALDNVLADFMQDFIGDEYGFKSLKHNNYIGASVLQSLDNGRCHRKTDGTAVTVPLGLPNGFLSTIMNFSGSPVTVTFNASEGARKQGSTAGTAKNSFVLAAWNTMFLTKAGDTTWMVAGEVA